MLVQKRRMKMRVSHNYQRSKVSKGKEKYAKFMIQQGLSLENVYNILKCRIREGLKKKRKKVFSVSISVL